MLVDGLNLVSGAAVHLSADPTTALEAATKQYADGISAGLDPKGSCRAATTANITLSAPQTIDGVSVIAGDRVLVKNQSDASQNGIYTAGAGGWTRSADFDGSPSAEVTAGAYTFIEEGSTNGDTGWVLTTNNPITVGSTNLAFTQFTAVAATTDIAQNIQNAAYTLALSDRGKHIYHTDATARVYTIPANSSVAFPIGSAITIVNGNGAGAITLAITSDVLRMAGPGTTGSRTIAANGVVTLLKVATTLWYVSGAGMT